MWTTVWITLQIAASAFFFIVIFGILAAWLVWQTKSRVLRITADTVLSLPIVLPPTVIGLLLLIAFGAQSAIGQFVSSVFHFSFAFTKAGAVLAAFVSAFSLFYRTMLGGFEQVDKQQIQAAQTLGFSRLQILWHVLLPNASSSFFSAGILSFVRALGEFGATSMLAGSIPGKTRTLSLAVYAAAAAGDYAKAAQYALVLILIGAAALIALHIIQDKTKGEDHA
jgi:molybdate transport system permease protein